MHTGVGKLHICAGYSCRAMQAVAGTSIQQLQICSLQSRVLHRSILLFLNPFFCLVQAKETLEQQQPPEVRILKQLLRIPSPQERQTALFDAFEPGTDLSTQEQDLLHT